MMPNISTSFSLWLICCVNFINSASIFDTNRQKPQSSIDDTMESLQPSVPSRTSKSSQILEEEAFSPIETWLSSDDRTKSKILTAFLQELPVMTEEYGRPEIISKRHDFGFMGNRGKRMQENIVNSGEDFINAIRPGFDRAISPLARLLESRRHSQEMLNNKRQPDFGFHAVRG